MKQRRLIGQGPGNSRRYLGQLMVLDGHEHRIGRSKIFDRGESRRAEELIEVGEGVGSKEHSRNLISRFQPGAAKCPRCPSATHDG